MSSVTIGDQKFVRAGGAGWVDAKTKQPADKGLLKLLDSMVVEEVETKKLRVNIDRRVEPIAIGAQKYIYDTNSGWIDEKTKIPAPRSLQLTLSNASPRFGKNDSPDIDLSAGFGMAGKAGLQKTRQRPAPIKRGGTLVTNKNVTINKPLVAMINQLSSIDSYLKQQLKNKQIVAAKNIAQAKESSIENKIQENEIEQLVPDATKESSNLAMIGGLVGLTALLATQFDPIKDALVEIADFGMSVGGFVSDIAKTLNSGFSWLLGSKNKRDISELSPPTSSTTQTSAPQPTSQQSQGGQVPPSIPESSAAATTPSMSMNAPTASRAPAPSIKTNTPPPVARSVSSAPAPPAMSMPSSTGAAAAPKATSAVPSKQGATSGGQAARVSAPAVSSVSSKNVVKVNHPDIGSGWGIAGAKDQSGRPVAFSKEGAEAFAQMIKDSGGVVKSSDIASSKRSIQKNASTPNAAKNSPHLRGLAMDIHGTSNKWIRQHGHKYGWKPHDYKGTHRGHFIYKGAGVIPDEGSAPTSIVSSIANSITDTLRTGKNMFGKVGAALVGAEKYQNMAPLAKAGAIAKTAAMAESRTPAPPLPTTAPMSLPNINPNKSSPVIESPATSNDMSSINYYLVRFGFKPAESELTK